MRLVALFSVCFGLCALECAASTLKPYLPNNQSYNRTLKALRTNATLRMLQYSGFLEDKVEHCLLSNFINKTRDGARRTLETASIGSHNQTKRNVTIHLHNEKPYPYIEVFAEKGDLEYRWSERKDVLFGSTRCFILEAQPVIYVKLPVCVVWGFVNESDECFRKSPKLCEEIKNVTLTNCQGFQQK
uniref:Putative secreted protein 94 n=1 Tax=Amblyomma americanum TaxID=6943 RepID=A0A0C9S4Y8_AMBAM